MSHGDPNATPPSPEELERDIEVTRDRLAETIDEIVDRAHPKNVLHRAVESVKGQFVDEQGNLRKEKVGAVAGAVAGAAALLGVIRRTFGRR